MSAKGNITNAIQSQSRCELTAENANECCTEKTMNGGACNTNTVAHRRYNSYRVAFYGSPIEQETYRQNIRTQLKEQVREKDDLQRQQLIERVAESDSAVASDRRTRMEDENVKQKKANYLKQFSNENKKIMEEREKSTRKQREADVEMERKLLDMNPINWNMTLH